MSRLGYLETQGSTKRLRMVQPGYDADDPATPPNKVIFDSNDLGTLSILETGEKTWTHVQEINEKMVTWDYDFVPMCVFHFCIPNFDNTVPDNNWTNTLTTSYTGTGGPKFTVSKTGIFAYIYISPFSTINIDELRIRWTAFRLPAA